MKAYLVFIFLIGFGTYSWLKRDTGGVSLKEDNVSLFAKQLVRESLKSPSTAQFVSTEVLYHKDDKEIDYYIVKTIVDAQNSFGATMREHYCVAFAHMKNEPDTTFRSKKDTYIQTCDDRDGRVPSSLVVDVLKSMNGYP